MPPRNLIRCHHIFSGDASFVKTMTSKDLKVMTLENINKQLIKMEYAILGPLLIKARQLEHDLKVGKSLPYKYIIYSNIGDAQAMGQKPITYFRQVCAAVFNPEYLEDPDFPDDVKEKAFNLLKLCEGPSIGAYTDPRGIYKIRERIARFIEARDNYPASPDEIYLFDGATEAIVSWLTILSQAHKGKPAGVMVPIPMYPLYSAAITKYGLCQIGYYLDESRNWELDTEHLEEALDKARRQCNPRAIVVINPSNPTGSLLTRQNIEEIIKFAFKERLFVFADEVYQENIYCNRPFESFKKIMNDLGPPYDKLQVCSLMSASKGYIGECGLRGGYAEICNICPKVRKVYELALWRWMCPNVIGQIIMDCFVDPPKSVGSASYSLFLKEKTEILESMAQKGQLLYEAFNTLEGFKCCPSEAAMYVFPSIKMPPKAIEPAIIRGYKPDTFYALKLLQLSGVCLIPGSGFGQRPGTYHLRATILPHEKLLKEMLERINEFHMKFMKRYD